MNNELLCIVSGCNNKAVSTRYHHHHKGNTLECNIRNWDADHCVFGYCEEHYNYTGENNASLWLKYSKNGRHIDRVIRTSPSNTGGVTVKVIDGGIVGGP